MLLEPQFDRATRLGELHGVVDQYPEELGDRIRIAVDGRVRQPDGPDVAIAVSSLRLPADGFDDGPQGDRRERQVLPGVGLGQGQKMLDQPAHSLAFAGDVVGGGRPTGPPVPSDRGPRRPGFRGWSWVATAA